MHKRIALHEAFKAWYILVEGAKNPMHSSTGHTFLRDTDLIFENIIHKSISIFQIVLRIKYANIFSISYSHINSR